MRIGLPIRIYRVAERSMEPSIVQGSYAVVSRWSRRPNVGDVVVFRSPEDNSVLIKRVRRVVGKGIFVVGDNEKASRDSRSFGIVEENRILGKVVIVV